MGWGRAAARGRRAGGGDRPGGRSEEGLERAGLVTVHWGSARYRASIFQKQNATDSRLPATYINQPPSLSTPHTHRAP